MVGAAGRALGAVAAAQAGWSLVLLAAAARQPAPAGVTGEGEGAMRFRVLVPAHDEERVLGETLAAVAALEHPAGLVDVVVVADHCTDATAAVARRAGARVLERSAGPRGKGAALAWALEQDGLGDVDAVLVLDADCRPSANLLAACERRLAQGAAAVQADYTVADPEASRRTALRWVAFRLVNTVRPLGRQALGLSAGLNGTGMAFAAGTLARHGWAAGTLVEDREQHLALVAAGERVAFASEASVVSPMPLGAEAERAQQLRWESGRGALVARWLGPLARRAAAGDRLAAGAMADLLTLPQALVGAAGASAVTVGVAGRSRPARRLGAAALIGQAVFVLGGLRVVGAPGWAYRALLHVPGLMLARLGVLGRVAAGRGPREFVRTERA